MRNNAPLGHCCAWLLYTIEGRLLQESPSKKGVVYISKGKKMLVK